MNRFKAIILAITFCLLILFSPILAGKTNALSDSSIYTNVLEDLLSDEKFNVEDYPGIADDYSMELIQIAESSDGELFLYVYAPVSDISKVYATHVNMSQSLHIASDLKIYSLTLLNFNGCFQKYMVNGLKLKSERTRYYEIISLFRPFLDGIDIKEDNDNEITGKCISVAKQYTMIDKNDKTYISVAGTDVIEIESKFVGFVRYKDGFTLFPESCDAYFVAFSTEQPIDKLYEATVYYDYQEYVHHDFLFEVDDYYEFENVVSGNIVNLDYTQNASFEQSGLFSKTYTWKRIESVDNFISTGKPSKAFSGGVFDVTNGVEFDDNALNAIQQYDWVLNFVETEYKETTPAPETYYIRSYGTIVENVTIIRLKFETDGVVYDLGVIDNMQTGSMYPSAIAGLKMELSDGIERIIMVLAMLAIIIILAPFLPIIINGFLYVIKLILKILKLILKAIIWVLTLPFRIFKGR